MPEDLVVLMLDGVQVAEHTCVVALGIDSEGCKHPLGLWEGATENKAVCRRALAVSGGVLVVIDGAKALGKAVEQCSAAAPSSSAVSATVCPERGHRVSRR